MTKPVYPRARLETLGDGVFAVAMTLLVLDLRLPDSAHPETGGELLSALLGLWTKALPYALSFVVLGVRWLHGVEVTGRDVVSRPFALWWLVYLLLVTCVPFSSVVVGRFGHLAPAVWVYSLNMLLLGASALRLSSIDRAEDGAVESAHPLAAMLLLVSALAAIAISLLSPTLAMWAYLLNAAPPLARRVRRWPRGNHRSR